jgi:hypothetical protein
LKLATVGTATVLAVIDRAGRELRIGQAGHLNPAGPGKTAKEEPA